MPAATDELARFVREALARRIPRPEIEAALAAAGWPRAEVERALDAYAEVDFPLPVPRPQPYLSARETFLYLLLFTALYLAAFHLGALVFGLIDHLVPDPARPPASESALRWNVAFLLVAFPLYLALTVRQERELAREPVRRASKVRKWLTYLTLFVAAGFLVGDVVALVYHFLEGELTLRFVLKVLVVAVLAGTAFGYYLSDVRRDDPW